MDFTPVSRMTESQALIDRIHGPYVCGSAPVSVTGQLTSPVLP
jgi:hypothetical protein